MSKVSDLQQKREEMGLSQADLAKRMGVSQGTISRIERGDKVPSAAEERLIAVALNDDSMQAIAQSTKPRRVRRAFVCVKEGCGYRRFLLPGDAEPHCPEHSRMIVQPNRPYRGVIPA